MTNARRRRQGLSWVGKLKGDPMGSVRIGRSKMIKYPRGALLLWVFDESEDDSITIACFLTNREASRVYKQRHTSLTMLEPIRARMRHRDALIVTSGKSAGVRIVTVPTPDEAHAIDFTELIFDLAAGAPTWLLRIQESLSLMQAGLDRSKAELAEQRTLQKVLEDIRVVEDKAQPLSIGRIAPV